MHVHQQTRKLASLKRLTLSHSHYAASPIQLKTLEQSRRSLKHLKIQEHSIVPSAARKPNKANSVVAPVVVLGLANAGTLVIQGFRILGVMVNDFAKVRLHVTDKHVYAMGMDNLILSNTYGKYQVIQSCQRYACNAARGATRPDLAVALPVVLGTECVALS